MRAHADHISWGRIRPEVEDRIEQLRDELCRCSPEQLADLQAEVRALKSVAGMFEKAARPAATLSPTTPDTGY